MFDKKTKARVTLTRESLEARMIQYEDFSTPGCDRPLTTKPSQISRIINAKVKPLEDEVRELKKESSILKSKTKAKEDSESPRTTYKLTTESKTLSVKAHGYREDYGWLRFWVYEDEVEMQIGETFGCGSWPTLNCFSSSRITNGTKKKVIRKINKDNIIEIKEEK